MNKKKKIYIPSSTTDDTFLGYAGHYLSTADSTKRPKELASQDLNSIFRGAVVLYYVEPVEYGYIVHGPEVTDVPEGADKLEEPSEEQETDEEEEPTDQEPFVFISYSRKDLNAIALSLAKVLKAARVKRWIDIEITPGKFWDTAVDEALESCTCLVVILTEASVASDRVLDEVESVRSHSGAGKVVPYLYEHCKVPASLSRIQRIDSTAHEPSPILTSFASLLHTLKDTYGL